MIPVGDSPVARRTPYVTRLLFVACVIVFLVEIVLGDRFILRYAATPRLISGALAGDPRVPSVVLLTLITSQFLHGSLLHLGGNMLFLWIFGDNVEDRLGHLRYLVFYIVCGIGAALAQVATDPASPLPLVGASGAISGVLGAYLLFQPAARITVLIPLFLILWPVQIPAIVMIVFWFFTQFASGIATLAAVSDGGGVAYWAHIAGFILGLGIAAIVPKAHQPPPRPVLGWPVEQVRRPVRIRRGPAGIALGFVSTASDVIQILLLARLVVRFVGVEAFGILEPLAALVLVTSQPLVAPFARILPALYIGPFLLELATILAIVVYQIFLGLVVQLLRDWVRYK